MSQRRTFTNLTNSCKDEPAPVAGYSRNIKLFQFLLHEYSGLNFILEIADSVIELMRRFRPNNKKFQRFITIIKYAIPAIVLVSEFVNKLKRFYFIKSGKNTVSNENEEKVREIIDLKDKKIPIDSYSFFIGSEVTRWLLQKPVTSSFKITGYYRYESLERISDTYKEDDSTIITVVEMDGSKFAWMMRMYKDITGDLYVRSSDIHTDMGSIHKIKDLKGNIYSEFVHHFDTKNNVLLLSPGGLVTYPRQAIVEKPKQFNIKKLSSEIRKILKRGKKRGFVFVGIPGTGKSTIIHCLEMVITEYPIVYISTQCFSTASSVSETFDILKYIQPCIGIIEDLDSCELKNKQRSLGELLEQIDDIDNKLNIILLATINDTSLVHYSLINRPGRFDEVIRIKTPQDTEEIYDVMRCRYDKNRAVDSEITSEFMQYKDINKDILENILKRSYTQADICEIIEKCLLIDNVITNESLESSVGNLEESKIALRECNFGGGDPSKIYLQSCDPDVAEDSPKCDQTYP